MDSLFHQITSDTTVLTANQRQAAQLRAEHDRRQRATGPVWESPDILPWDAWLQRLWSQLTLADETAPLLLTPLQERLLWERVIAESRFGEALLQPAPAARLAQDAWRLLHAYLQPLPADEPMSDEVRAFTDWAQRFLHSCEAGGWLDHARLGSALLQHRAEWSPAGVLLLAGFDELTPAQRAVLDAWEAQGGRVTEEKHESVPVAAMRIACRDGADELRCAARWARVTLEREPGARIAIVAPDLNAVRAPIARALEDRVTPAAVLPGQSAAPLFNLSLGQRLSDWAVVADALALLEFGAAREGLDTERLGALLRSPYLAGAERESGQRARLDARLREIGEPRYRAGTLLFHARDERHGCPLLVEHWEAWWSRCRDLPRRQGHAAWARSLADLLRLAGWPQGRSLDSTTFQAVEAWRSALGQLATLDEVGTTISQQQAVARLRQIATETLFQPRSSEVPIQVLGLLEAAGLQFDHVWLLGLHGEVWPPAPRPTPFLPIAMQRRCAMPHSSAERELQFARRVTRRLLNAAPVVVASWPEQEADRHLRASPLIADLPTTDSARLGVEGVISYSEIIQTSARLETLLDPQAPPLPADSGVRGGAALFKEQAACPFRAFARFRLGAEPLGAPQPGLDAATRGSLLHAALEALWSSLGDSRALTRLDPGQRRDEAAAAVDKALASEARLRPVTLTERFTAIERDRLTDLLCAWLDIEAQRAPFTVIAPEEERRVALGGLRLKARIDRIDRLDDGRHVIIDYKSGRTSLSKWLGDRPDEPQLPLYAVSESAPPGALAFAEVRAGQLRFTGLAQTPDLLPQAKTRLPGYPADWSWDELLAEWRATLTTLAEAFRAGDARVDPKRGPQTCRYCELPGLCRIAAGIGSEAVEEGDADD